jgi:hypothetical protein
MTQTKRSSAADQTTESKPFPGLDTDAFNSAGQAMLEMQRDWLVGMGKMQRDYLTFVGERMRKDIEMSKRMAECRDMKAAMELHTAFVETARDDYLEEAQRLIAMGQELTESCVGRLADAPAKANGKGPPITTN